MLAAFSYLEYPCISAMGLNERYHFLEGISNYLLNHWSRMLLERAPWSIAESEASLEPADHLRV